MDKETIRRRLHDQLVHDLLFGAEGGRIRGDDDLFELGLDSLAITRLVVFIDRKLGVRLPDAELDGRHFNTLDALTDFVSSKSG